MARGGDGGSRPGPGAPPGVFVNAHQLAVDRGHTKATKGQPGHFSQPGRGRPWPQRLAHSDRAPSGQKSPPDAPEEHGGDHHPGHQTPPEGELGEEPQVVPEVGASGGRGRKAGTTTRVATATISATGCRRPGAGGGSRGLRRRGGQGARRAGAGGRRGMVGHGGLSRATIRPWAVAGWNSPKNL